MFTKIKKKIINKIKKKNIRRSAFCSKRRMNKLECFFFNSRVSVLTDGSLSISQLALEDSGMYQCFAVNQQGEAQKSTWIKVNSKSNVQKYCVHSCILEMDGQINFHLQICSLARSYQLRYNTVLIAVCNSIYYFKRSPQINDLSLKVNWEYMRYNTTI